MHVREDTKIWIHTVLKVFFFFAQNTVLKVKTVKKCKIMSH